ncbi:MAG: hypothetical protein EBQ96_00230 [Proteobacteria bacterium]|nr:hypothetical protein [Pseudomonadota bacterium]
MMTNLAASLTVGNKITFDSLTNLYKVSTGATTAEIQAIINTASYGATIQFAAGTHTITQTLSVKRDGITLRGDATGKTTIMLADSVGKEGISFQGGVDRSYASTLSVDVSRGSHTITVQNATGLKVGDVIRVSQSNDLAFLKANHPNIIGDPALKENPLRESMSQIVKIEGNTVTLKHAVAYDMAAGLETKVERLNMLDDVALRDLTVTYNLGTPDANNFTNTKAVFNGADAVVMNYTTGAQISNLKVINAASTALEMRNALEANVNGLTVQGAHNKDDANGYGIHIAGSTHSTYQNLTITDVRHAVLFSSWNAEIGNTVHVAMTNRDINYHGSDDYGNFVIVDRAVYKDGLESWSLVSPGGTSHASTNIDLNTTLFGFAQGGSKNDILQGKDGGSKLYGMGGNDLLIGGNGADTISGGDGNDTIIGGAGKDLLWGGLGRDTFVMEKGDANDRIYDFQGGAGGDVIKLVGYDTVKSFADLKLVQSSKDVKLQLSSTETLFFKNTTVAKFTADNFVFDDGSHVSGGKGQNLHVMDETIETLFYTDVSQFGDTVRGFSTMLETADTLDLTALFDANGLGALTTDSAMSGGFLQLKQQSGSTALLFDRDGSGGVDAARTVALFEGVLAPDLLRTLEV